LHAGDGIVIVKEYEARRQLAVRGLDFDQIVRSWALSWFRYCGARNPSMIERAR
jgi:hypothetical protein